MKIKEVYLRDLYSAYDHPSAILFRAIELSSLYKLCADRDFMHPSLDLGCGDGLISELLFDDKFTYGVDNGEAKDVDEAIRKGRYQKIYLESAEKMSIPDQSLNFVFSNSVIEHIPNNAAVLNEVSRVLKPGGMFLFTSPSKWFADGIFLAKLLEDYGLKLIADIYRSYRNEKLNHYHIYDIQTYRAKLALRGMEVVTYAYTTSREAMYLWDKMALMYKLVSRFGIEKRFSLKDNFHNQIFKQILSQKLSKDYGANLAILARKTHD